jgi:hypothetical protein
MKYDIEKLKEEVDCLTFPPGRSYNLTSATHELSELYSSKHKRLVPIMLDCCLG